MYLSIPCIILRGHCRRNRMHSVPITTNVVRSNPAQCEVQSIQLVTGRCFSLGTPVSSTNKTDNHDITEILLKVALNTINQKPFLYLQIITTFQGLWPQFFFVRLPIQIKGPCQSHTKNMDITALIYNFKTCVLKSIRVDS